MNILKTRRELLRDALLTAGALTASGLLAPESILAQEAQKKGKGRRRYNGFLIGACDWTIGKKSQPEALVLAKKLGLDGVQADVSGPDVFPLSDPEIQKKYQETMQATGMRISTLAMGVLNQRPYFSEEKANEWVAKAIDSCRPLGARGILMAFFGKGDMRQDPKYVETTIAKLKEIAPKAEEARVKLLIESMLPAETLIKILDGVGSRAVGVYYDVANTQGAGYDIIREIKLLGRRIGEVHAKDKKDLYGKGEIDFPAVRKALDEIGYRGWIHMEGTKFPLGLEKSCQADAEYLRTVFPKQA